MSTFFRPRYRLRSLLIAMTLVALWCGHVSVRARNQKRAADYLGTFPNSGLRYDRLAKDSSAPVWLRTLLGEHFFQTAIGAKIDLPRDDATYRHALRLLRGLPEVDSLSITYRRGPRVYDALAPLVGFTRLSQLHLQLFGANASDEDRWPVPGWTHDMQSLTHLFLEDVSQHHVPDSWLEFAAALPALEELKIRGATRNTPDDLGLRHLDNSRIKTLDLTHCRLSDGDSIVFEQLPNLEKLIAQPSFVTIFGPWSREGHQGYNSEYKAYGNWISKPESEQTAIFNAWRKRKQPRLEFVGNEVSSLFGPGIR